VAVCLAVWWCCGHVGHGKSELCCQCSGTKKKSPVNRHLQGVEGGMEVVAIGLAAWVCHGRGGWWTRCLLPEYMRMKKKPINAGLQG